MRQFFPIFGLIFLQHILLYSYNFEQPSSYKLKTYVQKQWYKIQLDTKRWNKGW